jgi:glycosyltransferase involved in cell wall biosynthesis
MIVAPNSVDMSLFYKRDKDTCRKELGIPLDKFVVGFVGGFIERKGDKRLLAAVNEIDDVYVAFAGCGDHAPDGDKVVFCKALEHEQIPIFLNAIDVFCLPTQNEGSCNAIVEAAACGSQSIPDAHGLDD